MKGVTLTVLCDNTAAMKEGIRAEHGFSVLLEWEGRRMLFDTGQSDVFWRNSEALGKDLMTVDKVILSHGHYDHAGGLGKLATTGRAFNVVAHKDVFMPRYKKQKNGSLKYIGCPFEQDYLESRGLVFEFVAGHVEIAPGVFFISEVPQSTEFETGDPLLVSVDEDGRVMPDPFRDDATLYIRTPKGLVVVLGCSHRGVINILRYILTLEGDVPILTIIGGTHLSRCSREQREKTMDAFQAFKPKMIGVSHCTGSEAADALSHVFGKRFFRAMAGIEIKIDGEGGIAVG